LAGNLKINEVIVLVEDNSQLISEEFNSYFNEVPEKIPRENGLNAAEIPFDHGSDLDKHNNHSRRRRSRVSYSRGCVHLLDLPIPGTSYRFLQCSAWGVGR
jgi:hypothetical protein